MEEIKELGTYIKRSLNERGISVHKAATEAGFTSQGMYALMNGDRCGIRYLVLLGRTFPFLNIGRKFDKIVKRGGIKQQQ